MVLQVRVTDPDGSNSVILDAAKDKRISFVLNSDDEGGRFTIAKNNLKAEDLNPDVAGYTKFIEVWDTALNERKQFGPISTISERDTDWSIEFKGRSALLGDFIGTKKTFYANLDRLIDSLRYENIAVEPKTSTLVHSTVVTASGTTVFGSVTVDEKYYGLSANTKDNVIDGHTWDIPGSTEGPNTFFVVDSYWSGMSVNDSIIVDLGDIFPISRASVNSPNWLGSVRSYGRTYDFTLAYANDTESPITTFKERDFGPFHTLYSTGTNTLQVSPFYFNLGTTYSGTQVGAFANNVALDQPGPVDLRYLRVNISNTHAWTGDPFVGGSFTDNWAKNCDPNYPNGNTEGIPIDDRSLKPLNDCHASVLEITAEKEIFKADVIKPLALQRIDNDNLQITYFHTPAASETITTPAGLRSFEPGGFFRTIKVTYSGANSTYTKFFDSDCTNCYPDGFHFAVADQNNSAIYLSDSASGSNVTVKGPAFAKNILMKGASNAVVTYADAWNSVADPLSWGASYSFTEIVNDYAVIHFRGESFKWYATIPSNKTGATVKIEIRSKTTGTWSSWSTLENSYVLPNDVSASVVYEITYESGTLQPETIYEIKITNLGGFCSIDSFEGYWSASMSSYNDDSARVWQAYPDRMSQIYGGTFSNGTMLKWNKENFVVFSFEGDRFVILSAKGRNHGKLAIFMDSPGADSQSELGIQPNYVSFPGGTLPNGGILLDLDTGKRGEEVTQYILMDSNDYFPNGLPWKDYRVIIGLRATDIQTYSANVYDTQNFVSRCQDCKTPIGTETINKYVYFDSFMAHEKVGVSVSFQDQTYLEMLKSIAEAVQVEWAVTDRGIRFEPRIGTDTNIILREGQNTVVDYEIVNDATKVASMLFSSGADIDGLPLSTVTEDRKNRETLGRTIMRKEDFRSTSSYLQLIGLSRTNLRKRRFPEKRINVTHVASDLDLVYGDSFILYTKKMGPLRVRIDHMTISEDNNGRQYQLECIRWPILA